MLMVHQYLIKMNTLQKTTLKLDQNLKKFIVIIEPSLRKFYGRHHDMVDRYGISVSQLTAFCFVDINL
jgi:hypothetical protein